MKLILNINLGRKLIYFQIVYNLIIKFLISVFGFPSVFNYVTDIVTILLLVSIWNKTQKLLKKAEYKSFIYVSLLFFGVVTFSALFNFVSPFLYFWAFRNTFRFLIFMAACIVCLEKEDVDRIFHILFNFQFINIIACLFEYFILKHRQDNLGGIFGIESGCNGALNLFFCIMVAWTLARYLEKKIGVLSLIVSIASSIIIAALAELKFFYIEFLVIVVVTILLSRPSKKTIVILAGSIVGLMISLGLLKKVFPDQYSVLMNTELMMSYFEANTGGYTISRMNAFSNINELFFHDSVWHNLLGLGFGNCEVSSIDFFTSAFYKNHGYLNYRFFDHAMVFLETGFLGVASYILVFVNSARHAIINRKRMNIGSYWVIVVVLSLCCIMNMWYNNALKIEYSYMMYFALCPVAVILKTDYKDKNEHFI